MSISPIVLFVALCAGTVLGQTQPPAPDDCLMNCMSNMYKNSPSVDAMKMMDIQNVKVGNTTAMCPRMNDTEKFDRSCGLIKDLIKCTTPCPDTPIKKLSMSAFKGPQFMCVDRVDDVKKNMPCLSTSCPDVQQQCVPKCGSVEGNAQKITTFMSQVHGNAPPAHAGTVPPGGQKDVDLSQITALVGDTCTTISCFMSCSEAPVTKACGKDAYLLQRDLIWTMFSSLAQSMSSLGLQTQWPDQCKALAGSASATGAAGAVTVAGAGTATLTPPPGTVGGSAPPAGTGTTVAHISGGEAKAGTTTKAPPATTAGSSALIPSVLFLVSLLALAFRR